ncbi:MFS transporter [Taklimakanibacter deserti]|uniref:MFS transporter n=1 Tax=Taklimakanibacter deserti TaxID=2267839 RepID=UPI000E655C97
MPLRRLKDSETATLIIATSGVQLANGFFGTFLSLRVALEGFDPVMAGLVLSSYFAGFTAGALRCAPLIRRIGHIRCYAAFAGMVIAATAAMPLLVGAWPWIVLRVIVGFGCAGIFVTAESWLNAKAKPLERGRIFSHYMLGTFIALALGQLLIIGARVETAAPFSSISVLFALSLIIVSTTRAEAPLTADAPSLSGAQLFRTAPVAVMGSALSGLITAAFYALVPAWMQGVGIERTTIGFCMLAAVLGGLAFQLPIGWLSDRSDRRVVLAVLCTGLAMSAGTLVFMPRSLPAILLVSFLLGGFMSTLYPVSVAHAHDRMPGDRVVAVSGRLILWNGIGSIAGPLAGAILVSNFEINGILYLMAVAALVLMVLSLGRSLIRASPLRLKRPFRILAPQAARLAHAPMEDPEKGPAPNEGSAP